MKLTLKELRLKLKVGVLFTAEIIGPRLKSFHPLLHTTSRKVINNKKELVSEYLSGPKMGSLVYLNLIGVKAEERDSSIYLKHDEDVYEFLKITIQEDK